MNGKQPARRIVQIQTFEASGGSTEMYALCDDGTIWRKCHMPGNPTFVRVDISAIVGAAP
jgi:hypothetical protein